MKKAYEKFRNIEELFECPLCRSTMVVKERSFECKKGHCFDVSAKGYVNFIPAHRHTSYDKNLFVSRKRMLESGIYDCIVEEVKKYADGCGKVILDAGCGEGYFARKFLFDNGCDILAVDIEKDAVKMAAAGGGEICWTVADIANMPFADSSTDVLLNILSPANYAEFGRIIKKEGIIIKVVPGKNHLIELRRAVAGALRNVEYTNENVVEHFEKRLKLIGRSKLSLLKNIDKALLEDLFTMTPMTRDIDKGSIKMNGINKVTVDLEVLIGKKRGS